jgi:hypothetical protein
MESKKVTRFLLKVKLYAHIKEGQAEAVADLITKCGFEHDYFDDNITFLSLAVIQGSTATVAALVAGGAAVNLLSHVRYKWPCEQLFENFESALTTATRQGTPSPPGSGDQPEILFFKPAKLCFSTDRLARRVRHSSRREGQRQQD